MVVEGFRLRERERLPAPKRPDAMLGSHVVILDISVWDLIPNYERETVSSEMPDWVPKLFLDYIPKMRTLSPTPVARVAQG